MSTTTLRNSVIQYKKWVTLQNLYKLDMEGKQHSQPLDDDHPLSCIYYHKVTCPKK